jgi:hypothetical protein
MARAGKDDANATLIKIVYFDHPDVLKWLDTL